MTCKSYLTLDDLADRSAGDDPEFEWYPIRSPGCAPTLRGALCGLRELASSVLTWQVLYTGGADE